MKILFLPLAILAVAAVIYGLYVVGGPGEARLVRFDEAKIQRLQTIESQVNADFNEHSQLPVSIASLAVNGFDVRDPQTGIPFEYVVNSSSTYSLCANFNREKKLGVNPYGGISFTDHTAGHFCFERTVQRFDGPAKPGF